MSKTRTKTNPQVAIILPTYCEAENIADIIHTIQNLKLNSVLVVIDDSSPDGTQNIIRKLKENDKNIILLNRPHKMGLGTAIIDGFRFLLSLPKPPKHIITMDADYSHNPNDIPKLLKLAKKGYDLVIGSRYCKQGKVKGWTLTRLLISKTANKITRMLIKLPLNDFTSGFRCYSKEYIKKVIPQLHSETYEIQIETIRQAKLQNSKIREIPITFENRKKRKIKTHKKRNNHFFHIHSKSPTGTTFQKRTLNNALFMRCFATYNPNPSAEPPIQNYTIKLPETVNAVQKEVAT